MPRSHSLATIYQKRGRWYLDARSLGGGLVALVPAGAKFATTDRTTARRLAQEIASRLQGERSSAERLGYNPELSLRDFGGRFIEENAKGKPVSAGWGKISRDYLANALYFFEKVQPEAATTRAERQRMVAPRNMASITPTDVIAFQDWLRQQPNGRGGTYSEQTVRHHCTILSRLYRRAIRLRMLTTNPVPDAGLPSVPETDTPLLEVEDVALALEAARLIEAEANAVEGNAHAARRMVHVALSLLAYTGMRMDEAERVEWGDLMVAADAHYLRVHSAAKGAHAGKRRAVRLVPLSPFAVELLQAWRKRAGRVAGPILASPIKEAVPLFDKAFRAVERRANLPDGLLGSRTMRVAYATHRAGCDGVTWNDVREELGHADLLMQARVYGRGRLNREPMGPHLDYRWERWRQLAGERGARLESTSGTRTKRDATRPEREAVVRAFLAAVDGLGVKRAETLTGVTRSALQRLRTGRSTDVQNATAEAMRSYLSRTGLEVA